MKTNEPPRTFGYEPGLLREFPQVRAVALLAAVPSTYDSDLVDRRVEEHLSMARHTLSAQRESALLPIHAWRAVFAAMGLRPTKYRCAAEALLRRLRTRGELPRIHPLLDLCNSVSARTAVPIAVLDLDGVAGNLEVGHATGKETYVGFDGTLEHPDVGEVVFTDDDGNAHSRRWCHRQSGRSAVSPSTRQALIVAEAVHLDAEADLASLGSLLDADLSDVFADKPSAEQLGPDRMRIDLR